MRFVLKKILKYYLKYLTKLALFIHRPTVIAIAGSNNKTFVKDEINRVLRQAGKSVRSNPKSFNTEIGLPLAILNLPSGYHSYRQWLPIILRAPGAVLKTNFPEYLVLSLGVSDPGDMKYLLSIIRPKIAVISEITQRYLEAFGSMDELTGEYEYLIKNIPAGGLVALNYDNIKIRMMANAAAAPVKFFGLTDGSAIMATIDKIDNNGQEITVTNAGGQEKYRLHRFGDHHVYSFLVGLLLKEYVGKEK